MPPVTTTPTPCGKCRYWSDPWIDDRFTPPVQAGKCLHDAIHDDGYVQVYDDSAPITTRSDFGCVLAKPT